MSPPSLSRAPWWPESRGGSLRPPRHAWTASRRTGVPWVPSWRAVIIPPDVLTELPTPCLVVDVAAAERNIGRAAEFCRGRDVALRPHFKAHKCTALMRRQLAAGGCVGVTCQTSWEALTL